MESLCIYSSTANDAPTGNWEQWLAWVVQSFKSIKIETIKPNRLKSKHFQTSYTFLQPIPIRATLKWRFMALC
jgi:hypothetical protein